MIKYKAGGGGVDIASEPREERNFEGRDYVMERAITGTCAGVCLDRWIDNAVVCRRR